ncbi:GNAT family N-acetyltransferase [Thermomonas hydrothermalis]|uniref:N-acetyltransferase domain-containing protein n=1 Tax=Thermomonas hydrothermalis TaxID=213588 RepID=A0A1M4Z7T3_9GAMM|nr:GNAT family N-acetyltransferase [Thermomonas hydrothermalis]MCL6619349.1 N-acetyltransferase [Thermomonas hydrothermalis]SHF13812.1 hypothetical protein SAMN02745204_01870 [Thermomonas hydrothermalis]
MNAILHDVIRGCFQVEVDGHRAWLDYALDASGTVMTITHTVVPQAIGGRGIAAALTQAALVHAREQGWAVHPQCSYADAWMRRHPEFDALRA